MPTRTTQLTLAEMANAFLEVAKDPEMTALEELEAPEVYILKTAFSDQLAVKLQTNREKMLNSLVKIMH